MARGSAGQVLPDTRVTVAWPGAPGGGLSARADSQGIYRVCGVPAGPPLSVRMSSRDAVVSLSEVRVPAGRPLRADLRLPARTDETRAASAGATTGVLLDAAGQPLAGATVRLDSLPPATTDVRGRFRLPIAAAGEHRVAISHAATGSREVRVPLPAEAVVMELRAGGPGALAASVQRTVVLSPLAVRGESRSVGLAASGFYERQRMGIGHFVTGQRLHRIPGGRLTEVLRQVPGVRMAQVRDGGRGAVGPMRGGGGGIGAAKVFAFSTRGITTIRAVGPCWMDVYLDGALVAGKSLEASFSMSTDDLALGELDAVEVYQGAEIPPMYRNSGSACGVILIWTRRG
jgi:hypothetical protein